MATPYSLTASSGSGLAIVIAIAALVIGGMIALWYFSPTQKAKRALAAVRPTPLGGLLDGSLGKVVGEVALADESLEAPISRRSCVHYDVHVEQYRSSGKSGSWHTVIREVRSCDFLVEDGLDTALVDMSKARVVNVMDVSLRSGTFNDAPPEVEEFLASRGKSSKGWVFNKKMRYREGVLEPGERVAVLGVVGPDRGPEHGEAGAAHRGALGHRVLRAPPEGELIVSDDPAMGR